MSARPGVPLFRASFLFSWAVLAALVLPAVRPALAQQAASAWRPEARALFGKCKAVADGPSGRSYACPGFSASIAWIVTDIDHSEEQLLDMMRVGLVSVIPGELGTEPELVTLAGRELKALRVTVREPKGQRVQHAGHLVMEKQEGGAWMYMCLASVSVASASKDCKKALEFFAAKGVPEPLDLKTRPVPQVPVLFSQKPAVPEGCEVVSATPDVGRIQCPGRGALSWTLMTPVPDLRKWLTESVMAMRKQLPGDMKERPVDCTVGKLPGSCFRLDGKVPQGMLRMLVGVRKHEQQGVMLSCMSMGEKDVMPPMCDGLLEELPAPVPTAAPDAGSR